MIWVATNLSGQLSSFTAIADWYLFYLYVPLLLNPSAIESTVSRIDFATSLVYSL